ncbi:MAG: hypothetical protein ACXU9U_03935, partial [Parachlamydiaceae bacterium]
MAQQNLHEKIDKIEKVEETQSPASVAFEQYLEPERVAPNREHFDNLMGPPVVSDTGDVRKVTTAKNSIVEEVASVGRMVDHARRSSPQELIAQAQETVGRISELKEKLGNPSLELKGSVKQALSNKLSHIDDNLKIALSRSGIEYTPPPAPTKSQNSIERFLGLLSDSQDKLNTLSTDISRMDSQGLQFSPATMLVLQMKVG